jgi:hypothetical protein
MTECRQAVSCSGNCKQSQTKTRFNQKQYGQISGIVESFHNNVVRGLGKSANNLAFQYGLTANTEYPTLLRFDLTTPDGSFRAVFVVDDNRKCQLLTGGLDTRIQPNHATFLCEVMKWVSYDTKEESIDSGLWGQFKADYELWVETSSAMEALPNLKGMV